VGSEHLNVCFSSFSTDVNDIESNCFSFSVTIEPEHKRRYAPTLLLKVCDHIFALLHGDLLKRCAEKSLYLYFLPALILVRVLEAHDVAKDRGDA